MHELGDTTKSDLFVEGLSCSGAGRWIFVNRRDSQRSDVVTLTEQLHIAFPSISRFISKICLSDPINIQ